MRDGMIPSFVGSCARHRPTRQIVSLDDGETVTARELERRVQIRSGQLRAVDVSPGDRVGLARTNRFETVIDLLSCIRAGAIAAPLDATATAKTIERRLVDGDINHLIAPSGLTISEVDACAHLTPEQLTETDSRSIEAAPIEVDRPITLTFTSGTSGTPTPIVHTAWNHAAGAIASADRLGVEVTDRWYVPLSLHHMGGLAPVTRCLVSGIELVISATVGPANLFERLDHTDATILSAVPTMIHRAVEQGREPPPSMRCMLVGGAPLRESLYRRARSLGYPLWATYGLTETLGQVCTATPTERDAHPGTVGQPVAGVHIEFEDDDANVATHAGHLVLTSPTLSPSVTGVSPEESRFETADIGHRDEDGHVWIHGRRDDAIQTGGTLVFPRQVSDVLVGHPEVVDAGVVGLPDAKWGERVVAAIVTKSDIEPTHLDQHCRGELPPNAIPKSYITVEAIPRTISDTVDRDQLRSRLLES